MIEKVEKTKDKLWDILVKITKKEIQILQQCSGVRPLICPNKKHVGTEILSKIKYQRCGALTAPLTSAETVNKSLTHFNPLNSQWLTYSFSLQYPYIIQQTGTESNQIYQVEVVVLIKHQNLVTYLQGSVGATGEN